MSAVPCSLKHCLHSQAMESIQVSTNRWIEKKVCCISIRGFYLAFSTEICHLWQHRWNRQILYLSTVSQTQRHFLASTRREWNGGCQVVVGDVRVIMVKGTKLPLDETYGFPYPCCSVLHFVRNLVNIRLSLKCSPQKNDVPLMGDMLVCFMLYSWIIVSLSTLWVFTIIVCQSII